MRGVLTMLSAKQWSVIGMTALLAATLIFLSHGYALFFLLMAASMGTYLWLRSMYQRLEYGPERTMLRLLAALLFMINSILTVQFIWWLWATMALLAGIDAQQSLVVGLAVLLWLFTVELLRMTYRRIRACPSCHMSSLDQRAECMLAYAKRFVVGSVPFVNQDAPPMYLPHSKQAKIKRIVNGIVFCCFVLMVILFSVKQAMLSLMGSIPTAQYALFIITLAYQLRLAFFAGRLKRLVTAQSGAQFYSPREQRVVESRMWFLRE